MIDSQAVEHLSKRDDRLEDKIEESCAAISDLKVEIAKLTVAVTRLNGLGGRVNRMQRWIWLVTGGGIAVGVLISKGIEIFFGR
jgi:hypothetical protein